MRDKNLQRMFQEEKWKPDSVRMEHSKKELAAAVSRKEIQYRPSFWNLILLQVKYMEKKYCVLQLIFFVLALTLLRLLERIGVDGIFYVRALGSIAAFLGVGAMLGLSRLFSNHVGELEQTCYFNLGQMASVRLLLYGMADLFFLSILIVFTAENVRFQMLPISLYLITTFLVSDVCYFLVFTFVRNKGQTAALTGMALILMFASAIPLGEPVFFFETAYWIWFFPLFAAGIALVFEIRYVLCNMTEGELLCQN